MLQELNNLRQVEGEPRRRWFSEEYFDLIIWLSESDATVGFQLCYDKQGRSRALTWHPKGYLHHGVSDGEDQPGKPKATPVLVPDGSFDKTGMADVFVAASAGLEPRIRDFVFEKIKEY